MQEFAADETFSLGKEKQMFLHNGPDMFIYIFFAFLILFVFSGEWVSVFLLFSFNFQVLGLVFPYISHDMLEPSGLGGRIKR